jgi:RNA polymerase sigma-70 factor (ECF subfamily)
MLKAYLQAIVRDPDLAETTLSDVGVAIANSWERYDKSRPFPAWARGVARRVALANLRKRRARPVQLDANVLDAVGAELERMGDETHLEMRKRTLRQCIENLSKTNRELVRLRYFENRTYKQIAGALEYSINGLYVIFSRIHGSLSNCIKNSIVEST